MRPAAPSPALTAAWFDGRSSRARPVQVRLLAGVDGTRLQLRTLNGADDALDLRHAQVGWPERWSHGRAPPHMMVDLGPHGSLQIDDVAGWQDALAQVSHRMSLAERLQTRWPVLLAALLVAGAGVWAFYRWGTPWAAAQLTRHVPLAWELSLTDQALPEIDRHHLKPSQLPASRQTELRSGFDQLVRLIGPDLRPYRSYQPRFKLEFRSGMPANAFALPGGTIVMTDALVEQASARADTGDTALLGVLAHEIGHVEHRHTTRMVVEQGVLNVGLGLALGDVPTLVATGASLLTGLAYRRGHEIESDCYALALMQKAGLSTAPMGELLLSIDRPQIDPSRPAAPQPKADWFRTHPDTVVRAKRLKAGTVEPCTSVH